MSNKFVLYSSEGCHLCELALAICQPLMVEGQLEIIDIVEHEHLVELYGVHIPVLARCADGQQLFWPFDPSDVAQQITEQVTEQVTEQIAQ
jgi:hypothetical protein